MKPPDSGAAGTANHGAASAGAAQRQALAARLVESGFLRDPRLRQAVERVPRHLFVPPALAGDAYTGQALPIGHGQTITQVANVVRSLELLDLKPGSRVLEIGTGSGYQAALLSYVAGRVYSLERIPELAASAIKLLSSLGIGNVAIKVFDGTYGWSEHAPYDGIVVAASAPTMPVPLLSQLKPSGRIVAPVGTASHQRLLVVKKLPNGRTRTEDAGEVAYVPLVGRFGWSSEVSSR